MGEGGGVGEGRFSKYFDPGYYLEGEALCDQDSSNRAYKVFAYYPRDVSNPCAGGGIIKAHKIDGDQVAVHAFNVPPNVNVPIEIRNLDSDLYSNLEEGFDCVIGTGGHCLFDALNVYGFSLDKLMLVSYCRQFITEAPDSDGDGIPDPIDDCPDDPTNTCILVGGPTGGEPPEAYCYQEVVENKFGGCLQRIYCEHTNGTREFLREEETELVVECRHVFTNGECVAVHYFCMGNCHYYRKNGSTKSGGSTACDNAPHLDVCSDLNAGCSPLQRLIEQEIATPIIEDFSHRPTIHASLHPNPLMDYVDINIHNHTAPPNFQLRIYDLMGRLLLQRSLQVAPGTKRSFRLDEVGLLPPGVLIFRIDSPSGWRQVDKLLKIEAN